MKIKLSSKFTMWILCALLYAFAFAEVASLSNPFLYYASKIPFLPVDYTYYYSELNPVYFFGGMVTLFFLILSLWYQKENAFGRWLSQRRVWLVSGVLFIVGTIIVMYPMHFAVQSFSLLILTVLFFAVCMLWFYYMVLRTKAGAIFKKVCWRRFLVTFPIDSQMGMSMVALFYINMVLVLFEFMTGFKNSIFYLASATLGIVLLSYIASYLSNFASNYKVSYEKAVAEKIKSERFKTELITNVSHDIKTPLTSIINYVDLLGKIETNDEKVKEYTAVLEKKSQRLKHLIEDLIEASKAGTGNIKVNQEIIHGNEFIGQIAGEFDDQMVKQELHLMIHLPEEDVLILADRNHLCRVMENIFNNAIKYSLSGTRIYADLKLEQEGYIFSLKNVSREPLNISPDELTEKFVRGDRSRMTEGNGLGLNIARSLMEAMGGELKLNIVGDLFEVRLMLPVNEK